MKGVTQKAIVYSMIGLMQLGFGVATIEASPRHGDSRQAQRYESHDNGHDQDRERERQHEKERRIREEHKRHEREMWRNERESEREWYDRQDRERARHEEEMKVIGGLVILSILTSH